MKLYWVQQHFGEKIRTMNERVAKDGAFYLFTLRLVPLFPFFVINLAMGLTIGLNTILGTIHIYPILAEANKDRDDCVQGITASYFSITIGG